MQALKEIMDKLGGDPYDILQCQSNSSLTVIKKSYRTLAFKYHPDKNKQQSAKIKFIKINIAYEFLENQENRNIYEQQQKALKQHKQRIQNMTQQRRKLAENLKYRQQELKKTKQDLQKQMKKRKQFYQKKMRQDQQRQQLKNQILQQMKPDQYYQDVSSLIVQWEQGLSFNEFLLEEAFKIYGNIQKIQIQPKRKQAKIVFSSIDVCTNIAKNIKHSFIKIKTYLPTQRRNYLLKALNTNKNNQIDLSLNSDTIARLKQIINRNSNLYSTHLGQNN